MEVWKLFFAWPFGSVRIKVRTFSVACWTSKGQSSVDLASSAIRGLNHTKCRA
jgi:hypothetical protein